VHQEKVPLASAMPTLLSILGLEAPAECMEPLSVEQPSYRQAARLTA
jgi:hypothetical protein